MLFGRCRQPQILAWRLDESVTSRRQHHDDRLRKGLLPIFVRCSSSSRSRSVMPVRATRSDAATRPAVAAKSPSRWLSACARSVGPRACPFASCGWRIRKSCGDRSLIQPPAMFLPTVGREVFSCCWPFSSRLGQSSFQAVVGSVSIIVMLEPKEFRLQICCGPEQRAVEELAPNGADQALHERM